MKLKQTIRNMVLGAVLIVPFFAATTAILPTSTVEAKCGDVDTALINCPTTNENDDIKADEAIKNTGIWSLLIIAINILTAGVGVVALAGIVYGAVLYTSAGGNPEQVKKARTIFMNVAIGVIAFAAMFLLLNFLVPGGVFNQ